MYDKNGNLVDRREMLRVKLKSLMEEAKIIRHEERRGAGKKLEQARKRFRVQMKGATAIKNADVRKEAIASVRIEYRLARSKCKPRRQIDPLYEELRLHRIRELRAEARATHIAYALIRGRPIEKIETAAKVQPDWPRIDRLLAKYGQRGTVYHATQVK